MKIPHRDGTYRDASSWHRAVQLLQIGKKSPQSGQKISAPWGFQLFRVNKERSWHFFPDPGTQHLPSFISANQSLDLFRQNQSTNSIWENLLLHWPYAFRVSTYYLVNLSTCICIRKKRPQNGHWCLRLHTCWTTTWRWKLWSAVSAENLSAFTF
jgi:hypothetical protein